MAGIQWQSKVLAFLLASILVLALSGCPCHEEATPAAQLFREAEMVASVAQDIEPVPFTWLGFVMPEPGRTVAIEVAEMKVKEAFATKLAICLSFNPGPLMEPGDYFDSPEEVFARLSLEVNGETFTEFHSLETTDAGVDEGPLDPETGQPQYRIPGGAPYIICYAPKLEPGAHQATFVARKTSGDELRYSWSFGLFHFPQPAVLELPPLFIWEAWPGPGEALTVDQYLEARTFESLGYDRPAICLQFSTYELAVALPKSMDRQDEALITLLNSSYVEIGSRVIDDVVLNMPAVSDRIDVCYETELPAGVYTATLRIGEGDEGSRLSYSWSFVLVEGK